MMITYFIACPELRAVKIGQTRNVVFRFRDLSVANPSQLKILACLPGDSYRKGTLHKKFSHLHRRGEWFDLTEEIAAFLLEVSGVAEEVLASERLDYGLPDGAMDFYVGRGAIKAIRELEAAV